MRDDLDAVCLAEQGLRDGPEGDTRRGLPRAGPLEYGPGVGEAVFLHPGQVRMPGSGPGQRSVSGQTRQLRGVDRIGRIGRHDLAPLGPLGVADEDADRTAQGETVAHAPQQLDLVTLEAHPRATAVPEAAAGEFVCDLGARHPDTGR